MTNQEQILAALKGCSAQSPLAFGELIKKTGIDAEPLMEALQDLFDARVINRCTVTREDRMQVVVWPTGALAKRAFGQFAINPNKAVSAEYRPAEEKNSIQKQEQPIMEQPKSKARLMIELLLAQGSATYKELATHADTSSPLAFLGGYIKRGLIVSEGELVSQRIYRVAPDAKPEDFAAMKSKPTTSAAAAASPVKVAPSAPDTPVLAQTPGFFRNSSAQPTQEVISHTHSLRRTSPKGQDFIGTCVQCGQEGLTFADMEGCPNPIGISQDEAVIEAVMETTVSPAPEVELADKVAAKPRFRVALTSDQTILLFGLEPEPIELNPEQSQLPVNFASTPSAAALWD